ncbi:MAG: ComEC/Rec2 family competence protein [Cyanobacteria bacterium P01_A01_bin.45]
MIQASGVIICLGYILGLLVVGIPWGGLSILIIGFIGALISRRLQILARVNLARANKKPGNSKLQHQKSHLPKTPPKPIIWLIAGLIGAIATFYFQARIPQPNENDISKFVPQDISNNQVQIYRVQGEVASNPGVTSSGKGKFWLDTTQLSEVKTQKTPVGGSKEVGGKLYVTVPLLQITGLSPGQQVAVTGVLYQPREANNPGGFDFRKYLQQQGIFAGLSGRQLSILDKQDKWGWWKLRQRIVRSLVGSLGIPHGALVSAMVLGSKAVDLPGDIRSLFIQGGLAHTIAASGFHTGLILNLVLTLTRRAKKRTQIISGCIALILFATLTGFQPSVLRAIFMGFAALLSLALKRKVKQMGSLLVSATVLLLINPLWIQDLGFQLSFLATLGLIITVPAIIKGLQWVPPTIASFIAVPLAATIWTLPIQLHVFGVIPVYSIAVNIISTPLVSATTFGGIITSMISLAVPSAGSFLAGFLYYPVDWLIKLVTFVSDLPGNSFAVGQIALWQLLLIYLLLITTWLWRWWQKRWWFAGLLGFLLIFVPAWQASSRMFQITVMSTGAEPVVIIQDRGRVTLINSGDENIARFSILPFLKQQGVNTIYSAIASDFQGNVKDGWITILQSIPVQNFYHYLSPSNKTIPVQVIQQKLLKQKGNYKSLSVGQPIITDVMSIQQIDNEIPILQLGIGNKKWSLVGNLKPSEMLKKAKSGVLDSTQILWYGGNAWKELTSILKPQVAIISSYKTKNQKNSQLELQTTQFFFTRQDGAIQWTPTTDFQAVMQPTESKISIF